MGPEHTGSVEVQCGRLVWVTASTSSRTDVWRQVKAIHPEGKADKNFILTYRQNTSGTGGVKSRTAFASMPHMTPRERRNVCVAESVRGARWGSCTAYSNPVNQATGTAHHDRRAGRPARCSITTAPPAGLFPPPDKVAATAAASPVWCLTPLRP